MKLPNPVRLLVVAMMALTLGTVGCHKNPDRLTNIPGMGPSSRVGTEPEAPPLGSVPPIGATPVFNTTPIPPTETGQGFPASTKNLRDWIQNRGEFAAQTVYFDYDKSNIKQGEAAKLEEVIRRMKTMKGKGLLIEGHCDERGTEEYNRSLGDRRALSVREWLVNHGLSAELIDTISFGEDKPADPGHTEAAWSKNRRGEIILLTPP